MPKYVASVALVTSIVCGLGCRREAQPDYVSPEAPAGAGARVFSDEFASGTTASADDYHFYPVWGDQQNAAEDPSFVQGETATAGMSGYDPRAVTIANGRLLLTGSQETTRFGGLNFPYRGGMIRTKATYLYGYFEVRAKAPAGQGVWPVFWLMPPKYDNKDVWEVDVMEMPGDADKRVHMNRHWGDGYGTGNHHQDLTSFEGDFTNGFHVFAVKWKAGELTWFVDGVQRHQVTDHVPDVPLQVLLSLNLGGPNGWVNAFDGTTPLPKTWEVDYLRISRAD